MTTTIIILTLLILVTVMYVRYIPYSETKIWNNGKCRCGGGWRFIGMTVAGSRMFTCEYCDRDVIITDIDIK